MPVAHLRRDHEVGQRATPPLIFPIVDAEVVATVGVTLLGRVRPVLEGTGNVLLDAIIWVVVDIAQLVLSVATADLSGAVQELEGTRDVLTQPKVTAQVYRSETPERHGMIGLKGVARVSDSFGEREGFAEKFPTSTRFCNKASAATGLVGVLERQNGHVDIPL